MPRARCRRRGLSTRCCRGSSPAMATRSGSPGLPADTLRARAATLETMPASGARPALGRPVRGQGQYRRRRPADHRRLPSLRLHAQAVGDRGRPAGRRRCHPGRQDQPRPVRHRPGRRALALRRGPQPVRPRLHPRRLQLRLGCRGLGRSGQLRPRHRHGGLRPGAGGVHQHRRPQADQGHDPDPGRGPGLPLAGLRLDLCAHRGRCRCGPGGRRRVRPGRPVLARRGSAPGPRLRRPKDRHPRGGPTRVLRRSRRRAISTMPHWRVPRPWAPS